MRSAGSAGINTCASAYHGWSNRSVLQASGDLPTTSLDRSLRQCATLFTCSVLLEPVELGQLLLLATQ